MKTGTILASWSLFPCERACFAGGSDMAERNGVTELCSVAVNSQGTKLTAAQGSVVSFTGDAIVNAANTGCLGGGADGAISRAGGRELAEARKKLSVLDPDQHIRCYTGHARSTVAGDLAAATSSTPWVPTTTTLGLRSRRPPVHGIPQPY